MRRLATAALLAVTAMFGAQAQMPHTEIVASLQPAAEKVRFTWGAEFGGSVDLSAHDMSSIDFSAAFGLRYRWITFAGAGAAANVMVSNSCRTYPIFAMLRTSFSNRPRLVFVEARGGVALNYLPDNTDQAGPYGSLSIGFNLAGGQKFQSYITAGYTFVSRKDVTTEIGTQPYEDLSYAGIRLGVMF